MEQGDSPQAGARQAEASLPRQHSLPPVSWPAPGATDSHQVARSESLLGKFVEDLRACRNISGSGLCKYSLRRRNIEQTAHAVPVSSDSQVVRLVRGLQECDGRLTLPKRCFYVRIASPYLVRNLIHGILGLSRSRITKCLGL